jgi:hypothetical protein
MKHILVILAIASILMSACQKDNSVINHIDETTTPVTIDEVIENLSASKSNVAVTENYTDPESGYTGTLYEYESSDGMRKFLKLKEKPSNKAIVKSIVHVVWLGGNNEIILEEYQCTGDGEGCIGFKNLFIAWNPGD